MQTVEIPHLGEFVKEGKIVCWVRLVGEAIRQGEVLAYLETDKVNMEIESPASGVVRAIFVSEGETVQVGTPIALIGEVGEPLPDVAQLPRMPVEVRQRCIGEASTGGPFSPGSIRTRQQVRKRIVNIVVLSTGFFVLLAAFIYSVVLGYRFPWWFYAIFFPLQAIILVLNAVELFRLFGFLKQQRM
ncbi:MAG TPA: biotin/lipoyl-containing protein [Ktedonobacteraceae bacterium]|jgi:pyruvate/2-oxoglutarate dehydrogenase complex dihydrolipoamide acyltransferase (E2) component|nr:biotin/lipoyl-containing protein [Ktedonobacteraceae bacterium]